MLSNVLPIVWGTDKSRKKDFLKCQNSNQLWIIQDAGSSASSWGWRQEGKSIEYGSLYERIKDLFFPKERDGFDPLYCLLEIRRDSSSIILPVRRANKSGKNIPYISLDYEQVTESGMNLLNFALIPVEKPPQRQVEPVSIRNLSICRSEGNPH